MTEPHATCRETMEQLWELIDQELAAGDAQRLEAHLEKCQHCFPQYDFHRAWRVFIATCCRHDAPPALRRRIFMALLEEERRGA